jgi:hypothetical protein
MEMCIDSADDVPLSEQPIKTPAQTISAGHFIVNQYPFKAMGQNIKFGQPKKMPGSACTRRKKET